MRSLLHEDRRGWVSAVEMYAFVLFHMHTRICELSSQHRSNYEVNMPWIRVSVGFKHEVSAETCYELGNIWKVF